MKQPAAGRPCRTDRGYKLYASWKIERSSRFNEIAVKPDAGCIAIVVGELVLELNPDDARAIAWRMLEASEELDRPLASNSDIHHS